MDDIDRFRAAVRAAVADHEAELSLRQLEFVLQAEAHRLREEASHTRNDERRA